MQPEPIPDASRPERAIPETSQEVKALKLESGIGREFSLEGMLDSYTQRKNVTINLTH